jgi:hypothetical protein
MAWEEQLIFSIRPLDLAPLSPPGGPLLPTFDGGEIWLYDSAMKATAYLNHGGHLWDTLFDVRGTFGLNNENIDAIEAVATFIPEPSTWALLVFGLGAVSLRTRRE